MDPFRDQGAVWISAADVDWIEAGKQVLLAAGVSDGDDATLKSTSIETIGQALSGIAQDMGSRVGSEVARAGGEEAIRARRGRGMGAAAYPVRRRDLLDSLSAQDAQITRISKTVDLLLDVELPVSISFGRAQAPLKDVLKLTTGSMVELNRSIAEPVEVIVNNCVIAGGEMVVAEGSFGVRIHEVISRQERLRTLS